MAQSRPSIVIVGGGIGGLFVANALVAQGLRVSVYEQAPALGEVGAGVYITPNCVRQLQRVRLGPAVEKWGAKVGANCALLRPRRHPDRPVRVTDCVNATYWRASRDLVDMLAKALPADVVHTGHRCTGFERHGDVARTSLQTVSSPKVTWWCAEARNSLRAAAVCVCILPPGVLGHCRLPWRRAIRACARNGRPRAGRCGSAKVEHFLTYPLRAGALINFVGFVPVDKEMKKSWSASGDPEALRQGIRRSIRALALYCAASGRRSDRLCTIATRCHTSGPEPLTLLGDAAHAMLPHLGQGANQSIEDGMALATILINRIRIARQVLAGLLAYKQLRPSEPWRPIRCARERAALRLRSAASSDPRRRDRRPCRVPQAPLRSRCRSGSASGGNRAGLSRGRIQVLSVDKRGTR